MPDWAYHPFFRPVLFRLPAETARRVTIELLAFQARLPGGPALFEALARGHVPVGLKTRFVGIDFPSPIGLAAGIDVDGRAAVLMQKLGFGFLELGPLGDVEQTGCRGSAPARFHDVHGLGLDAARGAPAAQAVLDRMPRLDVPVGVQLHGGDVAQAAARAGRRADFLTLPTRAGECPEELAAARAATDRPLLVTISTGWEDARIDAVLDHAETTGMNGAWVLAARPANGRYAGEVVCLGALGRALEVTARVRDRMPVALSGGVVTPEDATAARDAGAELIALSNGFVFAGPGLPKRINRRLDRPLPARQAPIAAALAPAPPAVEGSQAAGARPAAGRGVAIGRALLTATAIGLLLVGAGYLVLALTAKLLPNNTAYLGMTIDQLCRLDGCRIVRFIAHNTASYSGITLANGTLWMWIVLGPLRRSEPWAWWALLLATGALVLGFSAFAGYGYFDPVHAAVLALLVGCAAGGLWLTRGVAERWHPLRAPAAGAWIWSPAGRGRLLLLGLATALVCGGTAIVLVAATRVFVPEDIEFLRLGARQVHAISPRLVPVMAHDRAEFGAGLLMLGILVAGTAWHGLRPGARTAWIVLGVAAMLHFTETFTAHVLIGYTNVVHLFPVYWGAAVLWLGLLLLRKPVWRSTEPSTPFPDV